MEALAPLPAVRDAIALELARGWIAGQGLHFAWRVGLYAGDGASGRPRRGISSRRTWPARRGCVEHQEMEVRAALFDALVERFNREVATSSSERTTGAGAAAS
jgi:hypothetical protein